MPRQRCLQPDEKKDVVKMIRVGGNKKKIQSMVMGKTGQVVLLKDLHNLAARDREPFNLASAKNFLENQPGIYSRIVKHFFT